jgi:multiple sugar transport system permease protein
LKAGIILVLFTVIAITPLAWHGLSSLKTGSELARIPPTIIPENPTFSNYIELFQRRPVARYYLNSLTVAALASALALACAAPAAYQLARSAKRFRNLASSALLAVALFPPIVFLFPVYELVRLAGLINHPWALILPYSALNLPFGIWLLTGYFARIPNELEEAAQIDGMSPFMTFLKIVLPLAAPALVTTGLLIFIFSWNEFMFALTFMNAETAKTITVGIGTLSGAFTYEIPLGLLAAGVFVSSVPLIVLVVIFQRWIVAGLTAGAVKE